MMSRLPRSLKGKEKNGFWLLNPASKTESLILSLLFLLLPTQLGKHFWPDFTVVSGIRIDYLSPIIYVTDVLLVLLFVFSSTRWLRKKWISKQQLKTKNIFLIGFIVLFFLCNILFASRPLLAFYGFVRLLEFGFLFFYITLTIRRRFQLELIALLFAIGALGESILAILQYLNQGSLNGIFYVLGERTFTGTTPGIANASINGELVLRPYATFSHPNVLAGYLLVAMVLVWGFLLRTKRKWMKIVASVSLLVSSVALLLTYSRVAILLWVLLIFIMLMLVGFRIVKKRKTKLVFSAVAVLTLLLFSLLPLPQEVYSRFAHSSLSEESVTQRTELITASWKMISQHPVVGVGLYNFIPSLAPLQKPLPLGLYLQPVHNIFVLVAAETGLVGLILFIWFLVATGFRIRNQESGIRETLIVLVVIILVTGFFDHYWLTLQQGQLLLATSIGLSWAEIKG